MIVENKGFVVATVNTPIEFWIEDESGWTPYFSDATVFTKDVESVLGSFDCAAEVRAMEVKLQLEI